MKKEYGELLVSIVLIIISAFPLFDLLYNVTNINMYCLSDKKTMMRYHK